MQDNNMRNFEAPYVFKEYPKWVTLADGSKMIVNNAEEEAVLVGPEEPEPLEAEQPATDRPRRGRPPKTRE